MLGTIERQGLICNGSLGSPERQGEGGTRRWNAVGGSLSLAAPRTPEPSVLVPPAVVFSLCPSLSLSLSHTQTHTHTRVLCKELLLLRNEETYVMGDDACLRTWKAL